MTSPDFAMRHRARRAALLAELLREKWDGMDDLDHVGDMDLAVARLSYQAWINAADEIAQRTGKPFHPPSDTTRAICIGLLSVPEAMAPSGLKGLC